jgi:hypothetical protein
LNNARSHVLRLPEGVDARQAAEALCGFGSAADIGWPEGDGDWLPLEHGDGWIQRGAITEVQIVDWIEQPSEIYT